MFKNKSLQILAELLGTTLNLQVSVSYTPYEPGILNKEPCRCIPEQALEFTVTEISDENSNMTGLLWLYHQNNDFTESVDAAIYSVLNEEQ